MGRRTNADGLGLNAMMAKSKGDSTTSDLFADLLSPDQVAKKLKTFRPLSKPVWSDHKAKLIEKYLAFFVYITKHGTYIDGFAGPQSPKHPETWSAKRVLESRPRFLRNFFLCDVDAERAKQLQTLWDTQPPREKNESKRQCVVFHEDFNKCVDEILASGTITEKEAAFALLDQRTFECDWRTVEKLAQHKKTGNKIELFYFLAAKWLHRSMSGFKGDAARAAAWWGSDQWRELAGLTQRAICDRMVERIRALNYAYVLPFPIMEKDNGTGGSTMYFMIHASDHDEAPGLMWRAYKQAHSLGAPPTQGALELSLVPNPPQMAN